jgi:pilus assembly protein CpaB
VLLALVGTGAVFAYVKRVDTRAAQEQQSVNALVAVKLVPAKTSLEQAVDKGLVKVAALPGNALPEGYLTEVGADADLLAAADILPGEPVLRARLTREVTGTTALSIPIGKIAVSVSLEDAQRVGDFVVPGSEIAVFETFNVWKPGPVRTPAGNKLQDDYDYNRATRLLLPRATVIAVGATTTKAVIDDKKKDSTGALSPTVEQTLTLITLALDQADAERAIHGAETGSLYFALLTKDSKTAPSDGVDSRSLFGSQWQGN